MFDVELEPDNSPVDNTNITTTQLYYNTEEHREFKELCKSGMVRMYGDKFGEANVSDFLLALLRFYKLYNEQISIGEKQK